MNKFCWLAFIFFAKSTMAASEVSIDGLAKDFEETKQKIEQQEIKQRQVLSGLYQINKKIKKTVTEKSTLTRDKIFVEASIRELSEKVVSLEQQARSQKTMLAERLRAIYQLGGQSLARLFLSSANSVEMERNLRILGIVAKRDLDLIKNYTKDLRDLHQKKQKLAARLEKLQNLERQINQKEKSFIAEQNLKNKILDKIRKSKKFAMGKINSLREKSLQYNLEDAGLFDLLFRPSFFDQKGQLPTPVVGRLSRRFGLVKSEAHPYTTNHKGIFIQAVEGKPIQTVFDGTVSFAGELPGFGKTLVIDHGDHYYTVYSHAKEIRVNQGDEVSQAQVIATVGRSYQDHEDGLYFEIRHFSEPYDPQLWMKGNL